MLSVERLSANRVKVIILPIISSCLKFLGLQTGYHVAIFVTFTKFAVFGKFVPVIFVEGALYLDFNSMSFL